ncbi:hypothetical protein EG329_000561 [Mollisiaceae sp. DMI_Dod_QoI]|nr:hypothetical protein EG329_000561 [Helotiales sp. DMI_Dod_QoI]
MSLAQEQAFSLPEIVETILLQLPLRDLLINGQLVCHSWNSAIQSPTLQQALFIQPQPKTDDQEPRFNPLLKEAFFPWFDKNQKQNRFSRGNEFRTLDWNSNDKKRAAYARKEASWRRMLPVQPPATTFEVDAISNYQMGSRRQKGEVRFEEGVRMGALYDYAQKTVAKPISSFWVEWHMVPEEEDDSDTPLRQEVEWKPSQKVTVHTSYTFQCVQGMRGDVGPEFRSEGYENLEITFESAPMPTYPLF